MNVTTTISITATIICCIITTLNFFHNRQDSAVKETKENNQELIRYQLKELKEDMQETRSDIKEIKNILGIYKDDFAKIIDEKINNHILIYHSGEKRTTKKD